MPRTAPRLKRRSDAKNTSPVLATGYPLDPALEFLQRLWRLNQALEKLSSHMEKRFGITAQQRLLMRCVRKYPGMTAGQLATMLHVDPGTVSAALKRLENKRLLQRRRDPRDKRRVTLGLSARGMALARPGAETVEHADDRLLASTSANAIGNVQTVLGKLTNLLDAEHESSRPAAHLRGRFQP
jgi:MarR family multiple antibiotic resistance transcriptional regulator